MSYQQIVIVGNCGRDAELKYTSSGIAVAEFSVAVTEVTGRGESRKEDTTWFKVSIWRERAENVSQFIKKGSKVMVVGKVKGRAYADKSGAAAMSLEINASEIVLLDKLDSRSDDGDVSRGGHGQTEYEQGGDLPF